MESQAAFLGGLLGTMIDPLVIAAAFVSYYIGRRWDTPLVTILCVVASSLVLFIMISMLLVPPQAHIGVEGLSQLLLATSAWTGIAWVIGRGFNALASAADALKVEPQPTNAPSFASVEAQPAPQSTSPPAQSPPPRTNIIDRTVNWRRGLTRLAAFALLTWIVAWTAYAFPWDAIPGIGCSREHSFGYFTTLPEYPHYRVPYARCLNDDGIKLEAKRVTGLINQNSPTYPHSADEVEYWIRTAYANDAQNISEQLVAYLVAQLTIPMIAVVIIAMFFLSGRWFYQGFFPDPGRE
jgi:hypothetical protein